MNFYFILMNLISYSPVCLVAILLNNAGIGIKTNNAENEKLSNNNNNIITILVILVQGDPTSPSEGDQSWDFFGGNDAKAETPVLWPPHAKS